MSVDTSIIVVGFGCAIIGWVSGWYTRKLKEQMDAEQKNILGK